MNLNEDNLETSVTGNIKFVRFPEEGALIDSVVVENGDFDLFILRTLRPKVLYGNT